MYYVCTNIYVPTHIYWRNLKLFLSCLYICMFHFSSVTQSCPTLCNPMDYSTPSLSVHHQLPEFTQTHVHCVGDAIQSPYPLLSSSPPAFSLSQHQGLFKWVSPSHQVAKYWSFSFSVSPSNEYSGLISFRMDWLDLLAVQGTLRSVLSVGAQLSLWSNSHIHAWLLEKP